VQCPADQCGVLVTRCIEAGHAPILKDTPMSDHDEPRLCSDCTNRFVITEAERAFFKRMDLILPKRCKTCRARRKAIRDQEAIEQARAALG
jgi:Probable zinc-ribbon domain